MDTAAHRIEEAAAPGGRFADKPLVEAAIRQTLGQTLENLGVADEEKRSLVQSYLAAALAAQDERREAAALWQESVPGLWTDDANTLILANEAIAALDNWHDTEAAGGYGEIAAQLRVFVAQVNAGL